MKSWLAIILAGLLGCAGCATQTNKQSATTSATGKMPGESGPRSGLIVTPENTLFGKVATYNAAGRFVVIDFPIGRLPVNEQILFVYRDRLKVGEIKVTGPTRDNNTVADLLAGEAQKGDEVRDR